MAKRNKIPKRGLKRYKHAYNKGYAAGKKLTVTKVKEEYRKVYPKIANTAKVFTSGMEAEYTKTLPDQNSIKWQGFTEAMNLIIASKRG